MDEPDIRHNQDHDEAGGADFDARAFRAALGRFPTGVTIVTTRAGDGRPVGVTVNSFNSVSLEPPLVLWSLQRASVSLGAFEAAGRFAVNVLRIDQIDLSNRFASPVPEKFNGVRWSWSADDIPLLDGCVARFECRTRAVHDGGDHVIFIGEVERFDVAGGQPLIFCDGCYMGEGKA